MKRKVARKEPFPWIVFLLFVGSLYLFWGLPRQIGVPSPQVEFNEADK